MAQPIPPFQQGTLEQVSKIIGDLYSGSELTRVLAEVPLRSDPGEGFTKWRRIAQAISANQSKTGNGNGLVGLVNAAMRPERTLNRKAAADFAKDELRQVLSLAGMTVRNDGKVGRAAKTGTDTEALSRTTRLVRILEQRGAHREVLAYCRPELLRSDHYEAVFEAIKGLGSRLRSISDVDEDGSALVDRVLGGDQPKLRLNSLATKTLRSEQTGVASLAKGLFSAFRNPSAHETRVEWHLSEQDALDVLATLSLVHRRLDGATLGAKDG